ncbi:hypothetical protein JW898_05325 [Candidatus Woesearchaeota archaeon]|nr:hypothetical protein [Candidatus Woesearchaeota archaeon]
MVKDYASKEAERVLADVHPEKVFNLRDGSSIKNIKELYSALQSIGPDVFDHHVNSGRNDFSSWVKDVHRDYRLADGLSSAKSREECTKAVASRIYEIEKMAEERKRMELKETETAAERLEKILTEAVKAKSGQDVSMAAPAGCVIVAAKAGGRSRTAPMRDKKARAEKAVKDEPNLPTAQELICEALPKAYPSEEASLELISFAEPDGFHRQFAKELSAVFSISTLGEFASDMKKLFGSGSIAEQRFLKERDEPEAAGDAADDGCRKDKMISHLKRVYE